MKLIAAVDSNWAIGYKNQLLVRIPHDQKWFQSTTMGKVIVLGHKTLETFPNGVPLAGRINIVLTTDKSLKVRGAVVVHSIKELLTELKKYNSDDVYVVGGEAVYKQLLDMCDTAYITKIDYEYEADRYFPNLDENENWELSEESDEQTYFDLEYTFRTYIRK